MFCIEFSWRWISLDTYSYLHKHWWSKLLLRISTNRSKKEQHQNGVENLSRRMLPKSVIKFKNEGDIDAQM
ncbi:hypothetical protein ACPV4H_03870 [Vibrio rotiferianus]|uniref:hypothetical protein n=1 Tax=Vibrio rotiferianus TaxID=190895 RepID=UPI00406A13E3